MIVADIEIRSSKKRMTAGRKKTIDSLLKEGEFIEDVKIPSQNIQLKKKASRKRMARKMSTSEEVYSALLLGTGDYVLKNGFTEVLIGMSGGIDSALVTTIAVDALGKQCVHGLFMPSVYTSRESREDATTHAKNLGISMQTISVDPLFNGYRKTLKDSFKGHKTDITEENLQARIRGNILMAFSNKFGWLVLTTGNKSEMSVGYATLYGDMAGGFAVIKDVPKTLVYELCKWKNRKAGYDLIPDRILWKEPTAELRPEQKDTDSLPPYPVLDPVLKAYVEDDLSYDEIEEMGCDIDCTKRVITMIDRSEYKRRQAPPGVKITPRAFGRDRRFPITNKYKNY
jgi:NAD+ synthase (glutamine-hydrolysing)